MDDLCPDLQREKNYYTVHILVSKFVPHLNTLMTAEIKVKFGGMRNANVDSCARGYIARLATLFLLVGAEKSRMMAFLHDNECDARSVVCLNFDACLTQCCELVLQDVRKLAFGDTVAIQDDAMWLVAARTFVEHY